MEYDEEGKVNPYTVIPMIDGGTEGFKGNARVILFGQTPCIECTLDLYPPQLNFPLCTIAHTPRLPEHCIEYARVLLWQQDKPFGGEMTVLRSHVRAKNGKGKQLAHLPKTAKK